MYTSMGLLREGGANTLEVGEHWYGNDPPAAEQHANPEAPGEPRDLVIVSNDNAMNAAAAQPRLQALYDIEGRWENKHWHKAAEGLEVKLADTVRSHTDLIISGGDGTVGWVLNWLLEHEELEDVRIVLVGAGNKNDKAVTLNGTDYLTDPLHVLDHGRPVTHYGIDILLPNGKIVRAQYIVGLGQSAQIAAGIDEPEYRRRQKERSTAGRTFGEVHQTIKSTRQAQSFQARIVTGGQPGQIQEYADLTIVASERAAGNYIVTRTTACHPNELAVKLTENHLHKIVGGVAVLWCGWSPIHTGDYAIELMGPTLIHGDGQVQAEAVGPGTMVFRRNRGIVLYGLEGPQAHIPEHAATGEAAGASATYIAKHAKPELQG